MRPTELQITDAVRKLTSSVAYREAEKRLDFWAVVLLGPTHRVPRTWSDNEGVWPARVGVTQDPDAYAARVDLEAGGVHQHVALAHVWTASRAHANRLKARLDELLLGTNEAGRLRHAWRNISDPEIDWPILLGEALRGAQIDVFDDDERMRRTLREARSHSRRR